MSILTQLAHANARDELNLIRETTALWIVVGLMGVATILLIIYQDQVVDRLRPFSDRVRDIPAGWLIWVALLFIVSFPPLIGDEVIEILCGIIYGLWAGFGVVSLGTYLGQSKRNPRRRKNILKHTGFFADLWCDSR